MRKKEAVFAAFIGLDLSLPQVLRPFAHL